MANVENHDTIGLVALDKRGNVGGYSIRNGFDYAVFDQVGGNRMVKSASRIASNLSK